MVGYTGLMTATDDKYEYYRPKILNRDKVLRGLGDYSFSTYAKFPEKLTFQLVFRKIFRTY